MPTATLAAPPTLSERHDLGAAARRRVPHESHAACPDPAGRDPVSILERQAEGRVPELVPLRYSRMLASPLSFLRGAAAVMAADLRRSPDSGLTVQLCGDAHLSNFGLFGSAERRLLFDLNDFDETAPGPWEWDVKRLAASVCVAAAEAGLPERDAFRTTRKVVRAYRRAMQHFAGLGHLEVWYAHVDIDEVAPALREHLSKADHRRMTGAMAAAGRAARGRDSLHALRKLTTVVDGEPRILADPPLLVPVSDYLSGQERDRLDGQVRRFLQRYARALPPERRALVTSYRFVDMARKVVGVGSVGTRCWILLLCGRDLADPLFLQLKEAVPSVLTTFGGLDGPGPANQGQRVVLGQRALQAAGDLLLGWDRLTGLDGQRRDFYVRQLRDWKGSARLDRMKPEGLELYGRLCAFTLARAHARTGDRAAIAAYLGDGRGFDDAVADFARGYAEITVADRAALGQAVEDVASSPAD